MANSGLQQSRWYFTKEQLENSPSRKCGIDADKELSNRQQAANLIQDMGQRLNVTQLCINTAIVYMHRFYVFHSFTKFHRNQIAPCALFLAAKVEEQPRKLEHVIKVAHRCLSREPGATLDPQSDLYKQQAARLVKNENIMLQTLGFEIGISHPHTFVVKCCTLVKASRDLAQTSYFMATNSLHLTTMCLMYRPTVVACACIHLACKWSSWEIPKSKEGKDWFLYVDEKVTLEELEQLTAEFIAILDKCPSRLKRRIMTGGIAAGHSTADSPSSSNAPGPSSTPNATFSSPMMTSPREEKPLPHSSTTSLPSMGYHQQQQQQHQQHVPSATVTSNQSSSSAMKEDRREEYEIKHELKLELKPQMRHDPVSVPPPAMVVPSVHSTATVVPSVHSTAMVVPSTHSTVQEPRPSQNVPSQVKGEMKESIIPTPSVSSSSFPSSHHHYQRDHSSSSSSTSTAVGVPSPSTVMNSHPQPIVLKIPLKGSSVHDSVSSLGHREKGSSVHDSVSSLGHREKGSSVHDSVSSLGHREKGSSVHDSVSSLGHRERSDSHGSSKSKNHHSQSHHVDDTHCTNNWPPSVPKIDSMTNNWPPSVPKIDSMKIKIVGGQVFKKDDEEKRKDDERYREEDRRKRKRDEFERGGSRRDSRDDKRSKDRSSKHHNR